MTTLSRRPGWEDDTGGLWDARSNHDRIMQPRGNVRALEASGTSQCFPVWTRRLTGLTRLALEQSTV